MGGPALPCLLLSQVGIPCSCSRSRESSVPATHGRPARRSGELGSIGRPGSRQAPPAAGYAVSNLSLDGPKQSKEQGRTAGAINHTGELQLHIPDRERKPNCVSKNSCFPKKKNSCFEPPGEEHSQDRDTQLCWPSESQYSVQGIISFLLTCLFA